MTAPTAPAAPTADLPVTTPTHRAQPHPGRPRPGRHQQAAQRAVDANTTHLDFHLGDAEVHLTLPPLDKLAFYAGLTGAAVFGLVEWPVAVIAGVGHLLSDDRRNRTMRALGEALDAAA